MRPNFGGASRFKSHCVRKKGECRGGEPPSAGVWGAPETFSFLLFASVGGKFWVDFSYKIM